MTKGGKAEKPTKKKKTITKSRITHKTAEKQFNKCMTKKTNRKGHQKGK